MKASATWTFPPLGEIAFNASETFDFQSRDQVIFINTGDVLDGKFLHSDLSDPKGLPGQAKKAIREKDILLSEIRPANRRFAYVDFLETGNHVVSTKFMIIRTKGDYSPRYLYHVLTSKPLLAELQHIAESRSGTFPQITFDSIDYLPIASPPEEHIGEITDFLDSIHDKTELNRRMNQTLEAMAQAIFKSWFVDFEPVKAKAAAKAAGARPEDIERAAMAAIAGKKEAEIDQLPKAQQQSLAQTAALFPDSFQDSELGEIPEGWKPSKLSDEVNLTMGQSPRSEFYNETGEGLPFHQGVTNYGARFPVHQTFCTVENRVAEAGDLLFSVRAPVGRINIADQKIVIGRGLSAMRHREGLQTFLTYLLLHHFQKEDSIGSGTIFNSVTKKELQSFPCVAPSNSLTQAFEKRIKGLDKLIALNDEQTSTLTQLRDTLLPKLLSGELSVGKAEPQTDETLA